MRDRATIWFPCFDFVKRSLHCRRFSFYAIITKFVFSPLFLSFSSQNGHPLSLQTAPCGLLLSRTRAVSLRSSLRNTLDFWKLSPRLGCCLADPSQAQKGETEKYSTFHVYHLSTFSHPGQTPVRIAPRGLSYSGFSLEDVIFGASAEDPPILPAVPLVLRFSFAHAPAPDPLYSYIRSSEGIPADSLPSEDLKTAENGMSIPDSIVLNETPSETPMTSVTPISPVTPESTVSPIPEVPSTVEVPPVSTVSPVPPVPRVPPVSTVSTVTTVSEGEITWKPEGRMNVWNLSSEFPRGSPISRESINRGDLLVWNQISAGEAKEVKGNAFSPDGSFKFNGSFNFPIQWKPSMGPSKETPGGLFNETPKGVNETSFVTPNETPKGFFNVTPVVTPVVTLTVTSIGPSNETPVVTPIVPPVKLPVKPPVKLPVQKKPIIPPPPSPPLIPNSFSFSEVSPVSPVSPVSSEDKTEYLFSLIDSPAVLSSAVSDLFKNHKRFLESFASNLQNRMNSFQEDISRQMDSLDSRMKLLQERNHQVKRLQTHKRNLLLTLQLEKRRNRGIHLCSINGNLELFAKRHASKRIRWNFEETNVKRIHEKRHFILMKLPVETAGKVTVNMVPKEGVSSEEFDGILSSISIASSVESILTKKVHSFDIPK